MATVEVSTPRGTSADAVWAAVKTPAAFRLVTRRLPAMPAIADRHDDWREGETVVGWVFLFGFADALETIGSVEVPVLFT